MFARVAARPRRQNAGASYFHAKRSRTRSWTKSGVSGAGRAVVHDARWALAGANGTPVERTAMGIYFLALVVLLTFVYLGYALFRPEKF
jgi:K+-transporting ATPase KdpF subunit